MWKRLHSGSAERRVGNGNPRGESQMSVSATVVSDGSALHEGMFQRLIELGIALSAERDTDRLTEFILLEAKRIPDAEGGKTYPMRQEQNSMFFTIMT